MAISETKTRGIEQTQQTRALDAGSLLQDIASKPVTADEVRRAEQMLAPTDAPRTIDAALDAIVAQNTPNTASKAEWKKAVEEAVRQRLKGGDFAEASDDDVLAALQRMIGPGHMTLTGDSKTGTLSTWDREHSINPACDAVNAAKSHR